MSLPSFQSRSRRFAEGGAMPAGPQGGAPAGPGAGASQGGAPDPGQQLQAAAQQYAQSKDPQLAVQIADMVVSMMGLGGGAPGAGDGDADNMGGAGAGAGAPAGGPPQMNKKGGKMPAFGKKPGAAGKPAFGPPQAKAAPAAAKPGMKPAAPAGKPMDAFQKLRAKKEVGMAKK